ncbi:hypothetical protein [Acaryochloris marina]|uniref:hypothetical protein n=1 Tax=Acaryochloris marina TaxID=155978 RepID=UPI001BAE779D|nr:hypothetical protein [Acaryochloris marina]QUY42578.1 hypothetical protein I1H34_26035 [Acaryochloris marina S15]
MRSRESLLAEIVDNPLPDPSVLSELKEYPWDCDKELVTITKAHICTVLAAFREKRLTAEQVRDWANRIEGRDDIGYELGFEGAVNEAIFCLANPYINYPIDGNIHVRIDNLFVD